METGEAILQKEEVKNIKNGNHGAERDNTKGGGKCTNKTGVGRRREEGRSGDNTEGGSRWVGEVCTRGMQ